ncbi:MAG: BolA family protein [Neisseria sp.]|nr:BolA family protein [Neisseria sp.]
MSVLAEIEALLQTFAPSVLELEDESHLHAGHAGNKGGGHYRLLIVSDAFAAHNRVQRQRIINQTLASLFQSGKIHALSIKALTENEYFSV